MKILLRIDSSSRTEGSHSRKLADFIENHWKSKQPDGQVLYRDLASYQIPHIQNDTILGFYTPEQKHNEVLKKALLISNELINELENANEILISSPLYNLNVPSNLKAYFDHVVRIGKTFGVDEKGNYFGMLKEKIAYLALAKGGSYKGTPMEKYDFQEPYLKAILHHIGIDVKNIFSIEGTSNPEVLQKNFNEIHQQIQENI